MGTKADAAKDRIEAAGKVVEAKEGGALHFAEQAAEVVSAMADPEGARRCEIVCGVCRSGCFRWEIWNMRRRGWCFLTNDGDLARRC